MVAHACQTLRMIIIAGTIDFASKADRDKAIEIGTPLQQASLAAHFQHENYFNMGGALRDCGITSADNKKYRVDLSEPVYDDTHTARADFFTA